MSRSRLASVAPWLLAIIVGAVLPFVTSAYYVDKGITLLINIIVVVSFRLIATTGVFNLAHIPLMGLGAYTTAILSFRYDWPVWLAVVPAVLVVALTAAVLSIPLSKIKGFAFFVASFAAGEAMRLMWMRVNDPFGGHRGLVNIPAPESISVAGLTVDFSVVWIYYFGTLVVTVACLVAMRAIDQSHAGQVMKAIAVDDSLAMSVGVNVGRYRSIAYVLGCTFAGIAGVLFAHRYRAIDPSAFGFTTTLYLLVWVMFGGSKTFVGPILGVAVLTVVHEALRPLFEWLPLVYGLVLIMTVIFLPGGLESIPNRIRAVVARPRTTGGDGSNGTPDASSAQASQTTAQAS